MPRLRIRLLVKLGVVAVALFFVGPYLFHLGLNEKAEDDAEQFRQWQIKRNLKPKGQLSDKIDLKQIPKGQQYINQLKPLNEKQPHRPPPAPFQNTELKMGIHGNYEPRETRIKERPGENGVKINLSGKERAIGQHTVQEFGFNMVASDKMAMNRVVPDTRPDECKFWHYANNQPKASVILVFHNEGFTTLVRTIHSVINNSPSEFLHEVVLVDDFSDKSHLKEGLEDYIKQFGNKVKLFRNSEREGLIRTRTRGAELATGDVIVFLDAHCECNRNWLVPLLDCIRRDRRTMAVPIVDGINWDNMEYTSVYGHSMLYRGIFEWGFLYKETEVPEKELAKRQYSSEPYRSPTHAGGLFAMDKKYFFELGGYDPGLMIWGGENYELSFKIWQCGGKIEWVPCSHVGHIYRNHMPYGLGKKVDPKMSPIYVNYMRVVEVWMEDEFKEYFYTREPSLRGYPFGNVSQQIQFKRDNKCKSFQWFMENVAYDVYDKFPKPPPNKAWGEIRLRDQELCWSGGNRDVGGHLQTAYCHGRGHSQLFRLNVKGQLGYGERCILSQNADTLHISTCPTQPVGPWEWDTKNGLIRHRELNKCVSGSTSGGNRLHLQFCKKSTPEMQWTINEIYPWKN